MEHEHSEYYAERSPYYDRVYAYPERQADLRLLESLVTDAFSERTVLEVAAGTGYWTQFIALSADSIIATDAEARQLEQLRGRELTCPVETKVMRFEELGALEAESFDGAFAGLWFSHINRTDWHLFFETLSRLLKPSSVVVLIDNSIKQCERYPISHTDSEGNTYQRRGLDSGKEFTVLKNFPSESELRESIAPYGEVENYVDLENFWLIQYRV